jgi:hypothetical protein
MGPNLFILMYLGLGLGLDFTVKKDCGSMCGYDPSAGSPTEPLLQLHLPRDAKI